MKNRPEVENIKLRRLLRQDRSEFTRLLNQKLAHENYARWVNDVNMKIAKINQSIRVTRKIVL